MASRSVHFCTTSIPASWTSTHSLLLIWYADSCCISFPRTNKGSLSWINTDCRDTLIWRSTIAPNLGTFALLLPHYPGFVSTRTALFFAPGLFLPQYVPDA